MQALYFQGSLRAAVPGFEAVGAVLDENGMGERVLDKGL